MKTPIKAGATLAKLLRPETNRQPRLTASGQLLYWTTPAGERLCIGVSAVLDGGDGKPYWLMVDDDDLALIRDTWGTLTAANLSRQISATARALQDHSALPHGITASDYSPVRGDTPARIIEALWQIGPARGGLLLKKKVSVLTEPISEHSPGEAQEGAPHTRGAERVRASTAASGKKERDGG